MTVRMAESAPGEVAEIDFGRLGLVYDPVTQKRRFHHALIVTLLHHAHILKFGPRSWRSKEKTALRPTGTES